MVRTCKEKMKYDGYIVRRMLRMELSGKRKQGRPKMRFMDAMREDMAVVEVTEDDAEDRTEWRLLRPLTGEAERRRRI